LPDEYDFTLMIKKGLLIFGLFAACGVSAQNVNPYAPNAMEEGVVYYLPKTQIEVKATVTKVTYTPGELCQYANRYLRINDISSTPNEYWEIKSVEVNTIGIPDANKAYSIKLKDKMATSKVELTDNGIIKAINTTSNIHSSSAKPTKPTYQFCSTRAMSICSLQRLQRVSSTRLLLRLRIGECWQTD
jgi:hypothetical protein